MGCHDAERDNAFDPALTPAVELQVALDDTAGTATLTWTQYGGEQPFAHYRVLRNITDFVQVDTLAEVAEAVQARFVDTTLDPQVAYTYRVAVVNTSGFEVSSQERRMQPLNLPPVEIVRAEFDAHTATAALQWTPYVGPRFRTYEIRRRTTEQTVQVVAVIEDRANTSFVDGELAGNTGYSYQVVVVTERGEEIYSEETSGIFHPLLATWSLDEMLEDIRPNQLFVRLYAEPGERIAALILGEEKPNGVRIREGAQVLVLDRQGQLVEKQILLEDSPNYNTLFPGR